jgi:alcohol dehydrogenase class IV
MNSHISVIHSPKIVTGRGSLSYFSTLGKKRIGVISYTDELSEQVRSLAEEAGAEICYLAKVTREPLIGDVVEVVRKTAEFQPDLILAIGGGSVLDTAKAVHLFYENPEMKLADAFVPFTLPQLGKKAVHIAVPTTSGTGSETTSVAVLIDPDAKVKRLLMDNRIIPHYAILDANLTDSLPDSIAISTGLDALTHAIEASVAKNASAYSRSLALGAASDILEKLELSVSHDCSSDVRRDAKEGMHIAASFAGIAITNSCTGLAHSYDHPGPAFGIPHGTVCGLMLPYTMGFCGAQSAYASLARRLGYTGEVAALSQHLIDHIFSLMRRIGQKTCFRDMGIEESAYLANIEEWSASSLPAFATVVSPADMTVELGRKLYLDCYYGNRPNLLA